LRPADLIGEEARQHVGAAACRRGDDDLDGSRGLRVGGIARHGEEHEGNGGKQGFENSETHD